jgi:hemolysin III
MRFGKEPWSAGTHFLGFVLAVVGLVVLVVQSAHSTPKVTAMAIYGGSLTALFGASTLYHYVDLGDRGNKWLRRLDHSAIFLLIAGSYMPPLFHLLDGPARITMISVVGGVAVLGVVVKLLWIDAPTWVGLSLYLALGWIALVPIWWMLPHMGGVGLSLLVGGGVIYTAGAIVYAKKWPDPWPATFGHHEVWHLFVLGGASMHYAFVFTLLDAPIPTF